MPKKEIYMDSPTKDEEYESIVKEVISEKIPFNKYLGLHSGSITPDCAKVFFNMRDDLMGTYTRGMLHRGVISSVIDATGCLAAVIGIQRRCVVRPWR